MHVSVSFVIIVAIASYIAIALPIAEAGINLNKSKNIFRG